ncbi:MAG: glycoside hydrolase family 16 protein [Fibrobacterota bacterium]
MEQVHFKQGLAMFIGGMFLLSSPISADTPPIREDFASLATLQENWHISSWGHDKKQYSPDMVTVDDGILRLSMEPDSQDGAPRPICGEITYTTQKFLYGSFAASIKTTAKAGGVVGWFVYNHGVPGDGKLHEIDMEYLTEDLSQIQLTLHHDGYGVDHQIVPVDFDPAAEFHEYRFDWYPDSVSYYIDGTHIGTLTDSVPDDSCSIMLNYWSNNDPHWGGPMPDTISHMYVDYMEYSPLDSATALAKPREARTQEQLQISRSGRILHLKGEGTYRLHGYTPQGRTLIKKQSVGITERRITLPEYRGVYLLQISRGNYCETIRITP